jgi:hypothetical protein
MRCIICGDEAEVEACPVCGATVCEECMEGPAFVGDPTPRACVNCSEAGLAMAGQGVVRIYEIRA